VFLLSSNDAAADGCRVVLFIDPAQKSCILLSHPIDSAIKYCQGAPSISAFFAEMGGNAMSLFSCRINSDKNKGVARVGHPDSVAVIKGRISKPDSVVIRT